MKVIYNCSGCNRSVEFNGHPMQWGKHIHTKKTNCCNRRWMILWWGWKE